MTKILIPHGTTPTGVGLRQRSNGSLRPLSPCCGRSMEGENNDACKGCGREWRGLVGTATLGNDVSLGMNTSKNEVVRRWIGRITGHGEEAIKLDVMWE